MASSSSNFSVAGGAAVIATRSQGTYFGLTAREINSTVALVVVTDSNGSVLDQVALVADATAQTWYGPQGLRYEGALTATVVGEVSGAVRHS